MTARKPLVMNGGQVEQLQTGDFLDGIRIGAFRYKFDSSTTEADPGTGDLRFDAGFSNIFISSNDVDVHNLNPLLASLGFSTSSFKARFFIQRLSDGVLWQFAVTSVVNNGTWLKLVATLEEAQAGLVNGDDLIVWATHSGDDGVDGASQGPRFQYDGFSVAESDPGSGKFRFDNLTISSATKLFISETNFDASNVGPFLATWDDSTSTIRGVLSVILDTSPTKFAIFNITGTITDNGTWDKFNITPIQVTGSFVNAEVYRFFFSRTGDAGGGGGAQSGEQTVDFGATPNDMASVVVTSQTWVTTNSIIVAMVTKTTTDHPSAEEQLIEQLDITISDLVVGTGFTIRVHAPNQTTGQYKIHFLGVA